MDINRVYVDWASIEKLINITYGSGGGIERSEHRTYLALLMQVFDEGEVGAIYEFNCLWRTFCWLLCIDGWEVVDLNTRTRYPARKESPWYSDAVPECLRPKCETFYMLCKDLPLVG